MKLITKELSVTTLDFNHTRGHIELTTLSFSFRLNLDQLLLSSEMLKKTGLNLHDSKTLQGS